MTIRCSCITSVGELADHEDRWEALRDRCGGSIFTSYDLSRMWLETYRGVAEPRVVIVEDGGDLVGVAPFSLRHQRFAGIPVGTLSHVGTVRGKLMFTATSALCEPGRSDVLENIISEMKRQGWSVLQTNFMEDVDHTNRFAQRIRGTWKNCDVTSSTGLSCPLPPEGDILEGFGKSTRKKVRQKIRGLENEGRIRFKPLAEGDIARSVDIHAQQHIERWQTKGGSIFSDPENVAFLRGVMKAAVSRGYGFAYELLIDGQVAAQQFRFRDRDNARAFRAGMNNAFSDHSPGMVLSYYSMTDLRDRGIKELDLGEAGEEDYKHHLGGRETPLTWLVVKRGAVSFLSGLANSAPSRRVDAALKIRGRLFGDVYH